MYINIKIFFYIFKNIYLLIVYCLIVLLYYFVISRVNPPSDASVARGITLHLLVNTIKTELVKNYDTFIVKIIQVYYNDVYDILCYVKYERYLLAIKYFIVLSFIFKQFYTRLKVLLKTPIGTFHKLTYIVVKNMVIK